MGPFPPLRRVPPSPEPDIEPLRLTPVDVASMDDREVRAILVHLAGSPDSAVSAAVVDAAREVLERTRVRGEED